METVSFGIQDRNRTYICDSLEMKIFDLRCCFVLFHRQLLVRVPEDISKQINTVGALRRF